MFFFFFKQKTAYEMRISDWSSDVCSSDLSSDRLMQGGDEVVVLLAVLVVSRAELLQPLAEVLDRQGRGRAEIEQGLRKRQQVASVAIGERDQRAAGVRLQRQRTALEGIAPRQQTLQRRLDTPLGHADFALRKQRPVKHRK